MQFKCPQCDFTSHEAGNCPTHNVALVEKAAEVTPEASAPEAQA